MIDLQHAGTGLDGYAMLCAQLESLLADERDFIANSAQFSAFLFNQLDDLNWAGFYLNRNEELVLGPSRADCMCAYSVWSGYVVPLRRHARPSEWKMCTRSLGISPVTARPTVSWWCRWSRTAN
jgi:hypothetical protein